MKRKKGAAVSSLTEACDAVVALSEEDGKYVTIFITRPNKNDDKEEEEEEAEEEANPGIVHCSINMLEAEAGLVVNEADNDTLNKKQKHKKNK